MERGFGLLAETGRQHRAVRGRRVEPLERFLPLLARDEYLAEEERRVAVRWVEHEQHAQPFGRLREVTLLREVERLVVERCAGVDARLVEDAGDSLRGVEGAVRTGDVVEGERGHAAGSGVVHQR
jgi:hypothetical protein